MKAQVALPFALVGLVVVFLAGALFLCAEGSGSSQSVIAEAEIGELQELTVAACICEREGGSEDGCWADYNARTAPYAPEGLGTLCAPVSTELDCFSSTGDETCIVTGYSVNGVSPEDRDVMVCTEAEARAIERAERAPFYIDGRSIDSANEEAWEAANAQSRRNVNEIMSRIRRGEPFPEVAPLSDGCV